MENTLSQIGRVSSGTSSVVVGNDLNDDAAVVDTGHESMHSVMTADVIAPIVDDPKTFGKIAAANSLSDIYAMGGKPLFALNLVFFSDTALSTSVLNDILIGGQELCNEAGCPIVGGHTVRDPEIKYGLSVQGQVQKTRVLSNAKALPGQKLILTKALGTGILGTAIKKGEASTEEYDAAVKSMTTLNSTALEEALKFDVTSCTDVTGFGFLGHLYNILRGSKLSARLTANSIPLLPGVKDYVAQQKNIPGGSRANLKHVEQFLIERKREHDDMELILADAQTSGGLLFSVGPKDAESLLGALKNVGLPASVVGELAPNANAAHSTIQIIE